MKNQKSKIPVRTIILVGIFIALNIIFVRFFSFQTYTIRFDFGFIPIAFASILFGPFLGGITSALGDVFGMLINSKGLAYFPPFTINAFLYGLTYGIFLHKKEKSWKNITICVLTQTIFINLFLTTIWLYYFNIMIINKPIGLYVILINRLVTAIAIVPIHIVTIKYAWQYLSPHITKELQNENK